MNLTGEEFMELLQDRIEQLEALKKDLGWWALLVLSVFAWYNLDDLILLRKAELANMKFGASLVKDEPTPERKP